MMPSELRGMRVAVLAVLALVLRASSTESDGVKDVVVSMNKVWPFYNPTETYKYYDFPFCQPEVVMPHFMTLGQVLRGDRLVNSLYKMDFKQTVQRTVVCTKTVTEKELDMFKYAIDANYLFELFVGDLPIDRPFGLKATFPDAVAAELGLQSTALADVQKRRFRRTGTSWSTTWTSS